MDNKPPYFGDAPDDKTPINFKGTFQPTRSETLKSGIVNITSAIANKFNALPRSQKIKVTAAAVFTLGLGTIAAYNALKDDEYTQSQCPANELNNALWQGADDDKRVESIRNGERILATLDPDSSSYKIASAVLSYWRADNNKNVSFPELDSEIAANPLVRNAQFIYNMRIDNYDAATQILTNAIDDKAVDCVQFWDTNNRRYNMAHRAVREQNYEAAYKIASHALTDDNATRSEFEWLAGYTKMLDNDAETAYTHFELARKIVSLPVSVSRMEYWMGRAQNNIGDEEKSEEHYKNSMALTATFYGQFSALELGQKLTFANTPIAESEIERAGNELQSNPIYQDAIQAAENKNHGRFKDRMEILTGKIFKDQDINNPQTRNHLEASVAYLARVATNNDYHDVSLMIAKKASSYGIMIPQLMFPIPTDFANNFHTSASHSNTPLSLTLALARRESQFDPNASSGADAHGLMQLIPSTARTEVRVLDGTQSASRFAQDARENLTNPATNIRLGTSYIDSLLDQYGNSSVMAIASYNAGSVDKWVKQSEDPRKLTTPHEMLDWIEQIPIAETREYVQRVLEGRVAYQGRLTQRPVSLETFLLDGKLLAGTEITPLPFEVRRDPPLSVHVAFSECVNKPFIAEREDQIAIPASLNKLNALYFIGETTKLHPDKFNLGTEIPITEFAVRSGVGLAIFKKHEMRPGETYNLQTLLQAIGGKSDAVSTVATVIAAGRARGWKGNDAEIYSQAINEMRDNANELEMKNTFILNATGDNGNSANTGNYSTPEDISILMNALYTDFPNTFKQAVGQINLDLGDLTGLNFHSARIMRNPETSKYILGAKSGTLKAAGFNTAYIANVPDKDGKFHRVTVTIFGADSKDHREALELRYLEQAKGADVAKVCGTGGLLDGLLPR